jgi:hypothetical protein
MRWEGPVARLTEEEERKLLEEWYGKGGKLEQSGFRDIEAYRPHEHGDKQPLLGKGARFISLQSLMDGDDDQLEDCPGFDFWEGNTFLKFQLLEGMALAGILARADWEAVVALSLFSEGVSEREVARIIGRSRGKTRDLLRKFKEAVDTPESILTIGAEETEQ